MNSFEKDYINYLDKHISAPLEIETFYHYTTMDALLNGIIRKDSKDSGYVCLRATHNRFFNDPSELIPGALIQEQLLEMLSKDISHEESRKKVINRMKGLFILSFSQNNTSLPMWTAYADKGRGVALGFKRQKSRNFQDIVIKCSYGGVSQHLEKKQMLLALLIAIYLPQIVKDEAYAYEQEVRLVGYFQNLPTLYRQKGDLRIPYKEILFHKGQLESITLGPCISTDEEVDTLRQFLDNSGFEHVIIKKSQIPYRNL